MPRCSIICFVGLRLMPRVDWHHLPLSWHRTCQANSPVTQLYHNSNAIPMPLQFMLRSQPWTASGRQEAHRLRCQSCHLLAWPVSVSGIPQFRQSICETRCQKYRSPHMVCNFTSVTSACCDSFWRQQTSYCFSLSFNPTAQNGSTNFTYLQSKTQPKGAEQDTQMHATQQSLT